MIKQFGIEGKKVFKEGRKYFLQIEQRNYVLVFEEFHSRVADGTQLIKSILPFSIVA